MLAPIVDSRSKPALKVIANALSGGFHGIIGTNKRCARETVIALLDDAAAGRLTTRTSPNAASVARRLNERAPALIDHTGWRRIDQHERRLGIQSGRPRIKLTSSQDLLHTAACPRPV